MRRSCLCRETRPRTSSTPAECPRSPGEHSAGMTYAVCLRHAATVVERVILLAATGQFLMAADNVVGRPTNVDPRRSPRWVSGHRCPVHVVGTGPTWTVTWTGSSGLRVPRFPG